MLLRQLRQLLRQKRQGLLGRARALATDAPVLCVGSVKLVCSVGLPNLLGVARSTKDTVCVWPRLPRYTRWTSDVVRRVKGASHVAMTGVSCVPMTLFLSHQGVCGCSTVTGRTMW